MDKKRWLLNQNYHGLPSGTELYRTGSYFHDQDHTFKIHRKSAAFNRMVTAKQPEYPIITIIDNGKTTQCIRSFITAQDSMVLMVGVITMLIHELPTTAEQKAAQAKAIATHFESCYRGFKATQSAPLQ